MKYLKRIANNFFSLMEDSSSFFGCFVGLVLFVLLTLVVYFPVVLIIAAVAFILGRILIGIFTGF